MSFLLRYYYYSRKIWNSNDSCYYTCLTWQELPNSSWNCENSCETTSDGLCRTFFHSEAVWDSSLHDSTLLNRVTTAGETVYVTLSAFLQVLSAASILLAHVVSGVVRIDRFLAGCLKRQLNQALSVFVSIGFLVRVLLCCLLGPLFVYC